MKKNKNKLVAAVFFFLGIIILLQALQIKPTFKLTSGDCGPKVFPLAAAIGIVICSIGKFFIPVGENKEQKAFVDKKGWIRILLFAAWCFCYVLALNYLGFLIASIVFLFLLILLLADGEKVNYVTAGILSVVLPGLFYVVFTYVLKVLLPRGILF